jgi:beta-phosphoglucomutase family hydrolase
MTAKETGRIDKEHFDAVLLDLDGVVTRTATVHGRAWKRMFDEYLEQRKARGEEPFEPFNVEEDFPQHVNGRPRLEGIRCFLKSRGIEIPEGEPDDEPGKPTVRGLGNRKNEIFREVLESDGVEVFEDTVAQMRRWRELGLKLAVVSSSKNCVAVLKAADLEDLFDARIDQIIAEKRNLRGKPGPDTFLEAARELGVDPSRAVVIEDAPAGVRAGRRGRFGLVVGVDRRNITDALRENGADIVVRTLRELPTQSGASAGRPGS